jgi:hypothetical protein
MANAWGELTWGINNWGQQSDLNVPVSNPNDEPYGTYPYGENDFGGSAGNLGLSTGSVTVTAEINRGWGRETGWGTLDWGTYTLSVQAPVTGQQLNISQGDESTKIDVAPTLSGEQLNWSIGNVDPNPDESLDGQQVNIALGNETISAGANVSVTGNQLNISQGDEEIDNITFAAMTGNGLVAENPGTVIVGGIARIFPTGVEINVTTGTVDPGPDVVLPSVQVNITTGTAILDANTLVDVTGQEITTTTGNVTFSISGSVQPTGNRVNIALGEENIQSWQIVDTGTSVAYTEVTTGSSVSWNEIDTAA